ncbi:hypothetical protein H2O64_14685 [Kordia sp. YSTF-M3]|uniref:CcmD family protein n=1 Tax=Kordia aestuariivivens TaxID=2759037 RepID=A0ABR7QBI2_9FLAO|nr:hypothetical protein [Kordia aestuariivivens]MBC8755922.1 hypothetical protein [Kordia aestuariivivens]
MSFFLYIYAVKIHITILLFLIFTYSLPAFNTTDKDRSKVNINSTVVSNNTNDTGVLPRPTITSNSDGGGLSTDKNPLVSILSFSILIFFSILVIILIDNRNLEKRYKKLVSDYKNKEPIL